MSTPLKSKTSFCTTTHTIFSTHNQGVAHTNYNIIFSTHDQGVAHAGRGQGQLSLRPIVQHAQFKMLVISSVFLVEYRIEHLPDDEAWECGCNWNQFQVFYDIKPGFYIGQEMWHLVSESTLFHSTRWLPVHPLFYKWHNFILFYGWIKLHCEYMPHVLYPLISRLVPYLTTMTRASETMDVQAPIWCAGLDPFRYRASRAQLDILSSRSRNIHPDFHNGHSVPQQQHPSPFFPACVPVFLRTATLPVSSLNAALTGISLVMQHVHVEHSLQIFTGHL